MAGRIQVTICVGSSCHVKGARNLVETFSRLLEEHGLKNEVELQGSFCLDRCGKGVNWLIDDALVTSESVEAAAQVFMERVITPRLRPGPSTEGAAPSSRGE